MNMRDFLTLVFKYKFRMLLIFFTVVALVTVGVLMSKPVYDSWGGRRN